MNEHPVIKQWDCRFRMALEIAKGINYLHSFQPPFIHRDLTVEMEKETKVNVYLVSHLDIKFYVNFVYKCQ